MRPTGSTAVLLLFLNLMARTPAPAAVQEDATTPAEMIRRIASRPTLDALVATRAANLARQQALREKLRVHLTEVRHDANARPQSASHISIVAYQLFLAEAHALADALKLWQSEQIRELSRATGGHPPTDAIDNYLTRERVRETQSLQAVREKAAELGPFITDKGLKSQFANMLALIESGLQRGNK
jgi:hypothetical protein